MFARLVVPQALQRSALTLHPDGADFAVHVERLVCDGAHESQPLRELCGMALNRSTHRIFKRKAAAGRSVVVLLQPAGSTEKRGLKDRKIINK